MQAYHGGGGARLGTNAGNVGVQCWCTTGQRVDDDDCRPERTAGPGSLQGVGDGECVARGAMGSIRRFLFTIHVSSPFFLTLKQFFYTSPPGSRCRPPRLDSLGPMATSCAPRTMKMTTPTQKAAADLSSSPAQRNSWPSTKDPAADGVAPSPIPRQVTTPGFKDEAVSRAIVAG